MRSKNFILSIALVSLLFSAYVLVEPALAHPIQSGDISVSQANNMIKHQSHRNPVVILDVRNESEYKLGHLDNAVLIPLHELNGRINELFAYQNSTVIVYCKAGSRSAPACDLLTQNGFAHVYNVVGGINAWMQAGYPIDTSYHYVSVDKTKPRNAQIDIEPFLLYQAGCVPCNQGCTTVNAPNVSNSTITVLDDTPSHTVFLISYIKDGSLVELTVEKELLWQSSQVRNGVNRTITLVSTTITNGDASRQIYGLADFVQASEYNMTLITGLDPLDSNTFNASITSMSYVPVGKNETLSAEKVVFNSSVTLSEQYRYLSDISKKIGKEYQRSPEESLNVFADRYYTIASEFALLSNIVKTQLHEYDRNILSSTAIIADDALSCLACQIGLTALIGGGCIVACILTAGLACIICLTYGWAIDIIGAVGVSAFCTSQGYCP